MTDNQFNELFRLVSLTANKVQDVEKRLGNLEQGQVALQQGQESLQQGQDALRREFEGFRDETRDNFERLGVEPGKQARVIKILSKDLTETRVHVEELDERVERLEHKEAA